MKNFFIVLLIIILVGCGYFLFNTNQKNTQFKAQINSLEGTLSGLTLQIGELQNNQSITGTTEEFLLELTTTNTGNMSLEEKNKALKEIAKRYRDALILEKLKNKSTTDTTTTTNKTTATTSTVAPTISTNNKVQYQGYGANCNRSDNEGKQNNNYFKAAKLVNAKLQEIWNNGQHLVPQYINEANNNLSNAGLSNSDKCAHSWLIDELQNQKGYLKSYKTQNGITKIGIDFVTYKESLQDIDFGPPDLFFQTKNTSTKIREYTLANNLQLQTLNTNNKGYVINTEKYLNNFNEWLNEFCNNESIYNGIKDIDRQDNILDEIDWNNFRGEVKNVYCVKNRLSPNSNYGPSVVSFGFNSKGEIQKIDLNRRYLSTAG